MTINNPESTQNIESQPNYHVVGPSDIPSWGSAHRKLLCESCATPGADESDCYYVSNRFPGVPMYNYGPDWGVVYNPHLVASYLTLLLNDAYDNSNLGGSLAYVSPVLNYFESSRISPHENTDVWTVNGHLNGGVLSDAMVQSQIALIYHRLSGYDPSNPQSAQWIDRIERAGNAFEWSWDKKGVAHRLSDNRYWYIGVGPNEIPPRFALNVHNKSILDMHVLYFATHGNQKAAWKRRIVRGIHALVDADSPLSIDKHYVNDNGKHRSYHRVNSDGTGGVFNDKYHRLNWSTTERIAARADTYGFAQSAIDKLTSVVSLWKQYP
jgi:hypothetical protein